MRILLATLLVACCNLAAAQSSSDAVCAPDVNCIRPVPRPSPPSSSLVDSLQLIRCHLACISEQNIDIQILDNNTDWPSYSYANLTCASQQKVDQCTLGCMTKYRSPGLTVNRCRDKCVLECEGKQTKNGYTCAGTCRRTFCRVGCSTYQSIQNDLHSGVIPTPLTSPELTRNNNSWKLYTTNISNSIPGPSTVERRNSTDFDQIVSYLYRIQSEGETFFMWQKDLRTPLDLSSFSCDNIQVSFAVVSKRCLSGFSPSQSLCVSGVGGWPSGVEESSIDISYTEDDRDSYLGYSVANISWTRPQNHQYLTSYTIYVYTTTQSCGGVDGVHSFDNIKKDTTWFALSDTSHNGVPKFGCSYQVSIVAMPHNENQSRPIVPMTPELTQTDPEMRLECRRIWDNRGFINISVDWVLSNQNPLPAIKSFKVSTRLINTSRQGLFGWLSTNYRSLKISPEEQKLDYNVFMTNLKPQTASENKYEIEVRTERGSQYHWRRVPRTKTCIVSAEAEPPATITHVRVSELDIDATLNGGHQIYFNISWSPPSLLNGDLKEYEVEVITTYNSSYSEVIFRSLYHGSLLSARLNVLGNTSDCLYARVRSSNGYRWSKWSKLLLIPYNNYCRSNIYHPSTNESVTLFYQRAGEEVVKIVEFSCGLNRTQSDSVSQILLALQEKLDDASPGIVRMQNTTDTLLERLQNIERKMDQLLDTASQNTTNSEE